MNRQEGKIIKRRDAILFLVLMILGAGSLILIKNNLKPGNEAEVYVDGSLVQTIDMTRDDIYLFDTSYGTNTVVVEGGEIRVSEADCPDKICMNMGGVSRSGETITCLPHKLVIEVHNDKKNDYDIK